MELFKILNLFFVHAVFLGSVLYINLPAQMILDLCIVASSYSIVLFWEYNTLNVAEES